MIERNILSAKYGGAMLLTEEQNVRVHDTPMRFNHDLLTPFGNVITLPHPVHCILHVIYNRSNVMLLGLREKNRFGVHRIVHTFVHVFYQEW